MSVSIPESPTDHLVKKRKRIEEELPEIEVDVSQPEPPSKKALRLQKKQEKQGSVAARSNPRSDQELSNESDDTPRDGEAHTKVSAAGAKPKAEHGIWIGNLPFTATATLLRSFLSEHGLPSTSIVRIHLPVPRDAKTSRDMIKPQNKGFAYIDFSTREDMMTAIGLSETSFGGRNVLIKDAKSFVGRPQKEKTNEAPGLQRLAKQPNKRVFIGNLGFDVTKEDLLTHYKKCGEIEDVHMATFQDSGKCKGYAWVTFADIDAAGAAVRGFTILPVDEELPSEDELEEQEPRTTGSPEGEEKAQMSVSAKKKPRKQNKGRKWFVNRIQGRPVRTEFAEDATTRYNKRYGKDPKSNKEAQPRSSSKLHNTVSSDKDLRADQSVVTHRGETIAFSGKKKKLDDT